MTGRNPASGRAQALRACRASISSPGARDYIGTGSGMGYTTDARGQKSFSDDAAERRLGDLVTAVLNEIRNRGKLSSIHAGARSWASTKKKPRGAEVATYTVGKGTALVVALIIVPLIAVSIGTFGAAPIGLAITAVLGFATKKLFTVAQHSSDVKKLLAFMHRTSDADDDLAINWDAVKPKFDNDLQAKAAVQMADLVFEKLISDVKKLDREIKAYIDSLPAPRRPDRNQVVAMMLKAEMDAVSNAQRAAGATGWVRPSTGQGLDVTIHPLSAKSGTVKNPADKIVHRLRRLRFYIRWLYDYVALLEAHAYDAIEQIRDAEEVVMGAAFRQVHLNGNHSKCGKLCFGPTDADLTPPPAPPVPVTSSGRTGPTRSVVPAARALDAMRTADASGPDVLDEQVGKLEKIGNKVFEKGVEKLVTDHIEEAVKGEITKIAGATVGDWAGGFVGDAIGVLVTEIETSFHVKRPLQNRVRSLHKQLQQVSTGGSIDSEIKKLAASNDLRAVLAAFTLVQSHYPKRIKERLDKFKTGVQGVKTAFDATKGDAKASPFAKCEDAGKLLRYMLKVQHVSEKQQIHILFVKYGLETIDRQIFREGYRRIGKEVFAQITPELRGRLKPLRLPPPTLAQLIIQKRAQLRSVNTTGADHMAAQRAYHGLLTEAEDMLNAFANSYVNLAWFKAMPAEPGFDGAVLTLKEWQTVSNVRFSARSGSTLVVDGSLDRYEKAVNPTLGRYLEPQRTKAYIERAVMDGEKRQGLARQLAMDVDAWIQSKSGNESSGRRDHLVRLQTVVKAEEKAVKDVTDFYREALILGHKIGMYA